jgi:hypothetical protein
VSQEQQTTEVQARQVYRRRKGQCRFYPDLRVVCRYPLDHETRRRGGSSSTSARSRT